ncbi:cytidine deaminase [Neosynechococcus sphagnicola sy1]|uniref:tRNA-specific adenosine deaminase n=1 Tax=Neosynechococcus sphagnicola sy1 TaxID=1497020 RepID=A0A098TPH2_9CYAN|nr:tRNA adenosine(34) deaminase TadA [Neosynechococcus sphagnicola]KGF72733.1 cytidine deaminase [Neosynechococcus sphagnicola sy1]
MVSNSSPLPLEHPDYLQHRFWMGRALELATMAGNEGEVPVGAVILNAQGQVIAESENRRQRDHDPTAHAEILALRTAGQALGRWHLIDCTLYVTLEPCPMCAGALLQARLGCLIYGVDDPKTGAIRTVLNLPDSASSYHRLRVLSGIREIACRQQLQDWFAQRR